MENAQKSAVMESIFLEQLPCIEKIVGFVSRKHGLPSADADDFASIVKMKLIENDYAVLRKFRGESSLPTFLAVVIAGFFRDHRVQRWGRWRPSALARSYGAAAIRLETLLFRDGYSSTDAIQLLTTSRQFALTEKELRAIIAKLPCRELLRPVEVSSDALAAGSAETPLVELVDLARVEERARVEAALNEAFDELSAQDRVLLKMKFWEGMTVADMSRIAGLPQKQLYRRLEKIAETMKTRLRRAGVSSEDVRELIAH
jgi:RNA polymerase sigma factor (sigma-70 family)